MIFNFQPIISTTIIKTSQPNLKSPGPAGLIVKSLILTIRVPKNVAARTARVSQLCFLGVTRVSLRAQSILTNSHTWELSCSSINILAANYGEGAQTSGNIELVRVCV